MRKKKVLPYSRQFINKRDILEVNNSLKNDLITTGNVHIKFENALSNFCNVKYSVVSNSATSGLHLACLALELNSNEIVWCSANSFVSTANCAVFCGAKIDFVDINLNDYNIDASILELKLQETQLKDRPKILIITHIGGYSADMKKIYSLSKKYNFKIIEDASHALGAKYENENIGSCRYSHITVFSFHPIKSITTGEGGACLTNSRKYFLKMKLLRSHGIEKNIKKKNYPPYYYEQKYLGYNYRMSDINAALGLSQLKRIGKIMKKREAVAKIYRKKINRNNFYLTKVEKNVKSSNHLFIVRIKSKKIIKKFHKIIGFMLKNKLLINTHYFPIYLHPFYRKMGFKKKYCVNAEKYYNSSFSIPVYENIKLKDINYVLKKLNDSLKC